MSEKIALFGLSSLDLRLPYRVLLPRAVSDEENLIVDCLPCGFLPLRRIPDRGQLLAPEDTSFRLRAFSAFLTLSRPFSTRDLPALFHAGPAPGVPPFRVDLHSQSRTSSRMPLPSWGSSSGWASVSTIMVASGIGVPWHPCQPFRGGAFSSECPFRALLPASVHFSGPIV